MLRASPQLTVGQASHYYRSEFSRGDYYTERESESIVASRWHGHGAEQLGLMGRVKADDFSHLLEGHDPSGKHVLVPHREGLSERRAGWDVTISPHKSVSLAALVGGDKRLLEAHDRTVDKALSELERHAQAWAHGGRDVETTGLVVAASFRHETSRALDPQLHCHCVILNVTRRADGEWRAVNARGIFRAQRLAREIYEAELAKELRGLGYEVKSYRDGRTGRDRAVGIAGFGARAPEALLQAFSRDRKGASVPRAEESPSWLARHGGDEEGQGEGHRPRGALVELAHRRA
jgi:conjugative relaxase-like TrwC/TraI family protein